MKKIINGKKYDTETARELVFWDNGYIGSDFSYVEEVLYKKKTGEYFLKGFGGPMSKYAESHGNNVGWGEKIIPMSEVEAKKWSEEKLSVYKYEELFGEVEE